VFSDNHPLHIREHLTVLASPDARANPEVVANVRMHVQAHLQLWKTADPALLAALGVMPPPMPMLPPGMAPGGPPGPGAPPPAGAPPGAGIPGAQPNPPPLPKLPTTGERYSPTAEVNRNG
jgi:hypothetical protein